MPDEVVSEGAQRPPARVALCEIRSTPLSVDEVLTAIADPACGGQVVFIGRVRDHDHGRGVDGLHYEAHPAARERMAAVCERVATAYDVRAVAAVHRAGDLAIGDIAVVIGVAAPHRGAAFDAGRDLIDTLKSTVPIWKHQAFTDGSDEWVGLP